METIATECPRVLPSLVLDAPRSLESNRSRCAVVIVVAARCFAASGGPRIACVFFDLVRFCLFFLTAIDFETRRRVASKLLPRLTTTAAQQVSTVVFDGES